jgi:Effector Associated Constant Component 1
MDMEISISGPNHLAELASLEDWLLREPRLADCPITLPPAVPAEGRMGALSDVLVVALGSGGTGAVLAGALTMWLRTRVNDLTIHIHTENGDLEYKARSSKDPNYLISAIRPLVPGNGASPS